MIRKRGPLADVSSEKPSRKSARLIKLEILMDARNAVLKKGTKTITRGNDQGQRKSEREDPGDWKFRIRSSRACHIHIIFHTEERHAIMTGDIRPQNLQTYSTCLSANLDYHKTFALYSWATIEMKNEKLFFIGKITKNGLLSSSKNLLAEFI